MTDESKGKKIVVFIVNYGRRKKIQLFYESERSVVESQKWCISQDMLQDFIAKFLIYA